VRVRVDPSKPFVLVTNVKDEISIEEWLVHNLLLGFGHIVIIDDASRVPLSFLPMLKAHGLQDKVTVLGLCHHHLPIPKVDLQTRGVHAAGLMGARWTMHLDADEFIWLKAPSLHAYLQTIPPNTTQVLFQWIMFGSSYLEDLPPGELMLSAYNHRASHVHSCTKGMVYVGSCRDKLRWEANGPHYFKSTGSAKLAITASTTVFALNHVHADISKSRGCELGALTPKFDPNAMNTVIAHYYQQARMVCVLRKLVRVRDDNFEYRFPLTRNDSFAKWDKVCNHGDYENAVEDRSMMGDYARTIKPFLSYQV